MRSNMYNPPHPGEVLKELYLKDKNLSITATARFLGVTRENLSSIVNGHTGISPEMALRLSKAFKTDAEMWLNMQKDYELWHVEQKADELLKEVIVVPEIS